ncbi:MAG: alpha/beta hydrolase, partial [Candidatus Competibacteraceae bacterium]|nr:alpha/beta hydrolase [Candidatus Competibacteraceae bacterium]
MALNLLILTVILLVLVALWRLAHRLLGGPDLSRFDLPLNSRVDHRCRASEEHQQAVALHRQAAREVENVPRNQRLPALRRMMARGFMEPSLLSEPGYRIEPLDADGVPGEWVLAPHSDPDRRLLYLHGGSFVSGCPRGHRVVTTHLARVTGCSVLALDYRLLPEHSRRQQHDDCRSGYGWITRHGPSGPGPARELWVAGDSAGGNLALSLVAWVRDAGATRPMGAIALSPSLDMTFSSPSIRANLATDLMLGPGFKPFLWLPRLLVLLLIWRMNRILPHDPLISPLFGDLAGLPPVLIQASEAEMMVGDARRYVHKARAAGSAVELQTWPDVLHVWHLFAPLLPEAREAFEGIGRFVERCRAQAAVLDTRPHPRDHAQRPAPLPIAKPPAGPPAEHEQITG